MTDDEASEYYSELQRILNAIGLDWVVRNVNERIQYGRTSEVLVQGVKSSRSIDSKSGIDGGKISVAKGAKARYQASEEYTSREQLHLLVDSIRTVAVHSMEVEEAVLAYFKDAGAKANVSRPSVIQFLNDQDDERESIASVDNIETRRRNLDGLLILLTELERNI